MAMIDLDVILDAVVLGHLLPQGQGSGVPKHGLCLSDGPDLLQLLVSILLLIFRDVGGKSWAAHSDYVCTCDDLAFLCFGETPQITSIK